jgi:hypothetical protein
MFVKFIGPLFWFLSAPSSNILLIVAVYFLTAYWLGGLKGLSFSKLKRAIFGNSPSLSGVCPILFYSCGFFGLPEAIG